MTDERPAPPPLVGLIRVREHCTFAWRRATPADEVSVEIRETHCAPCIAEARRRGYRLLTRDGKDYSA